MEFKYKDNIDSVSYSDDFWYALTNEYIDLDILEDGETKDKLIEAIGIVEAFENDLTSQDFFEEM
jgi:hypothetical protein